MTPDQIVTQGREALQAAEEWLEANGRPRDFRRVKLIHSVLQDIANHYVGIGEVSALSVGGDKP